VAGIKILAARFLFTPRVWTGKEPYRGDHVTGGLRTAHSDAQGAFEILGVSDVEMYFAAISEEGSSDFAVAPAGSADPAPVTLVVRGQGSLEGRVLLGGAPIGAVTITATPRTPTTMHHTAVTAITGGDGRFVFEKVPEGEVAVTMARDGQAVSQPAVVVRVEAGERARVELAIGGGALSLSVHAKAQPGHRVDSADVALFPGVLDASNGQEMFERAKASQTPRFTTSHPYKAAAFRELRAGTYTVCAVPFTGAPDDRDLAQRAFHHRAKRPAVCKLVTVTAAPAEQQVTIELPSMPALPPVPPGNG
jgi:hypothetical protein